MAAVRSTAGVTPAEAVLEALDPEQQAVATTLTGPVCVIAGAGTGKTRAITHRIAYGVLSGRYDPHRVLAVTFTTRAAGEMRGRLRVLGIGGVQARTFHSAALRQARYFWPQVTGRELPAVTDSKLPLVGAAANRCRLRTDRTLLRDLASEIEWAKVTNVGADAYVPAAAAAGRVVAGVDADTVARVYAAYDESKTERGLLDFEDILLAAVGLLATEPGVAEAVRAQYHQFVVDEYQDVSPVQQKLLELWLGDRDDVCVVGDPAQTIYSFAGASAEFLGGFPKRFPAAQIVRLVRDYRSTPQVVATANAIVARGDDAATRTGVRLQAQRPSGPEVTFAEHPDEVAEAGWLAGEVARLMEKGTPAREIAVLYRVNAQSEAYEDALAATGVPYVVRGAERFFERAEVRQAAMLLRAAVRSGDPATRDAPDAAAATSAVLTAAGWSTSPPAGAGAARERWESLAALVALAAEVAASNPDAGLADVLAELDRRAAAQHAPVADGVTLASLHAAKGLEWDAVFVVGCHDGTLPISYADTPAQLAEERRLLYVGVTRARQWLRISWSLARTPGARPNRGPSRFLAGVRPAGTARGTPGVEPGSTRRAMSRSVTRCRVCGAPLSSAAERKLRRCAGCPSSVDKALFDRLRTWRLVRAQEQKVPAYVVFTDATLTAIAEARPADENALAALPGVGRTKLERYGADVLELCRAAEQ
ncbi:MAG: UvrD-helicase domain-containing protein [Jiangellaceae bacterium]|nr:UvrD-helicase domain-containing protein [Jiangellaceae bacterium]